MSESSCSALCFFLTGLKHPNALVPIPSVHVDLFRQISSGTGFHLALSVREHTRTTLAGFVPFDV